MTARAPEGNNGTASPPGEHAVVIGASVAGLLAASALAGRYARVTVLERDELPEPGLGRRAIPQGRHLHALLASGRRCFDELLPGLSDDLRAAGAVPCSVLEETCQELNGHRIAGAPAGFENLLASRPLFEGQIRRRVAALANVSIRDRCEARELVASPDRARMEAVRVAEHDAAGEHEIPADLVVAAGGRAGRVPAWLETLGYEPPAEDVLAVDLGYASRPLRLRPGALGSVKLLLVGPRPGLPRGIGLFAQEGGRWLMTVSGYGEHRPPTDERGLDEFVASVAPPEVAAAVREAEPLGEVVSYRFTANRRRRYERLRRFPAGLLVTGDALCSFNPLYGQGMSVAALEAVALRRCLEGGERGLARRFHRAAAKAVDPAWELAIGGDLALPEVAGERSLAVRVSNAYFDRLLAAAERDPVVARALARVGDLLEPPGHVLRPGILWRVIRRRSRARASTSDPVSGARPSTGEEAGPRAHRRAIVRAVTNRVLVARTAAEAEHDRPEQTEKGSSP